jgi:hypothetical protein
LGRLRVSSSVGLLRAIWSMSVIQGRPSALMFVCFIETLTLGVIPTTSGRRDLAA